MTTITIDEETKEELLKIAAQLQIKKKEKINYDTAIKFLIAHQISNYLIIKDENKLRKACEKIDNIDVKAIIHELYEERKKDEISF